MRVPAAVRGRGDSEAHRPTFVSFFSGCGGLDLGFSRAGFKCLLAVDNDPEALAVHQRNLRSPTARLDLGTERPGDRVLERADAFVCGPPCQGFSTMGGRRATDPRNPLVVDMAKLAGIYMPDLVVIENVLGSRSQVHRHHWAEAEALLVAAGYRITTVDLDVLRLGVPQTRRRVVLVAWRGDFDGQVSVAEVPTRRVLSDVLTGLEGVANHAPRPLVIGSRSHRIAASIAPGQKLCNVRTSERCVRTWDIPLVFGETTPSERLLLEAVVQLRRRARQRNWGDADPISVRELSGHLAAPTADEVASLVRRGFLRRVDKRIDLVHTFNGKFKRPRIDGPAPTVDTRFGDHHYFLHPIEHRSFTVREAARIQSFPDDFVFDGSTRSQFRMVGNAVPPTAARQLAGLLRKSVLT